MRWHEDFEDEPSVEERMPFGLSPSEMQAMMIEARFDTCEQCGDRLPDEDLIATGMYEYFTMDIDPESKFCPECYELLQRRDVPSDPSLFDGLTPLQVA